MRPLAVFPETAFTIGPVRVTDTVVNTWIVMAAIILAASSRRRLAIRPTRAGSARGCTPRSRRRPGDPPVDTRFVVPVLGTLWLFIGAANLAGLVPGMKTPTADLNTTFALALVSYAMTHVVGLQAQGLRGYLAHYAQPTWLLLPFHLIAATRTSRSRCGSSAQRRHGRGRIASARRYLLATAHRDRLIQAYIFGMLTLVFIAGGIGAHPDTDPRASAVKEKAVTMDPKSSRRRLDHVAGFGPSAAMARQAQASVKTARVWAPTRRAQIQRTFVRDDRDLRLGHRADLSLPTWANICVEVAPGLPAFCSSISPFSTGALPPALQASGRSSLARPPAAEFSCCWCFPHIQTRARAEREQERVRETAARRPKGRGRDRKEPSRAAGRAFLAHSRSRGRQRRSGGRRGRCCSSGGGPWSSAPADEFLREPGQQALCRPPRCGRWCRTAAGVQARRRRRRWKSGANADGRRPGCAP
jgi:F-type H+-transporting ATPase subunit a